ncbi:MAG: hypothetical protein H6850_01445 [Alphaproteobacteria bacterium]|nr:MAG: hypothetical protein H6850_01445 [Alphaproteobacteria bacterium]
MSNLFGNFFEDYPRGFCLFLLVGDDKTIFFGPRTEHSFATQLLYSSSASLITDLRRMLKNQIAFNIENPDNKKPFSLFFSERIGHSAQYAQDVAAYFSQFLNQYVFSANALNECGAPIYLKNIFYNGYSGGIGVDKKKDFAHLIYDHQKTLELSPRHKITLEVPDIVRFECPKPPTLPEMKEPEVQTIYVQQPPDYTWIFGMMIAAIAAFAPLVYYAAKD